MKPIIKEVSRQRVTVVTGLIRESFFDVAERFGLTPENCYTHPSFCTEEWVEAAMIKGVRFYVIEENGEPRGCVALERHDEQVCYLERLAVLPRYRRKGLGKALVEHVMDQAEGIGARRVEIGIISDQTELEEWYRRLGFSHKGNATFDHLPFQVTFMARDITL
jgi:GNAT superfamily N-acetyltransferase